ncbi:MAG TPA: glycine--tRNA ligase subunit beta, partial [Candidatus Cloacimonadota bacterium]|nr:glycine--tRNA ligase subunit beta [Candidatus Cloacimonadota bacterium]
DAMWFYHEDTRHTLESFTGKLGDVVFQSKLGSMAEKTSRIVALASEIAGLLGIEGSARQSVLRTARLCKADLVTLMLGEKEFTKLQGYIGMHYALASGEDAQVAQGIYEHYMPRGSNDSLPETIGGKICAIADKMDTLCGIIGIGLLPTGSGDPFALRRAASGIVQIVAESNWDLDVFHLAEIAMDFYPDHVQLDKAARGNIHTFLKQRIVWLLKERGIFPDVIASVMHVDMSHIGDLIARADALNTYKLQEDFLRLVTGFKRVSNIIEATGEFACFDVTLAEHPAELALYDGLLTLRDAISEALQGCDYPRALDLLVSYGGLIDNYFDSILVNCEDPIQKNNHYALLHMIRKEFLRVADLSLIVMDIEKSGV